MSGTDIPVTGFRLPPPLWGVWLQGEGWLKDPNGRVFADLREAVAESAARLAHTNAHPALVLPIDEGAMWHMERIFLEHEAARRAEWAQERDEVEERLKAEAEARQEEANRNRSSIWDWWERTRLKLGLRP